MDDKERLQRIVRELEEYGLEDLTEHGADSWEIDIWWLIEVIEKQEQQLQQSLERIRELEMKYENTGAIFNRQYMQAKIERYEKALEEILYHYPTPIDEELDYEKAYSEVKEIAKRAWEGED